MPRIWEPVIVAKCVHFDKNHFLYFLVLFVFAVAKEDLYLV